jgi:hypothetical protein
LKGLVEVFDGRTATPLPGLLGSFHPFPHYNGGLYVAAGDVNGDGRADVIVSQGENSPSHVRVFSGANGALLEDFRPYAKGFNGGVRVAAGDVNGDGKAEVIVAPAGGGAKQVKVFNGLTGAMLSSWTPFANALAGGLYVAAGDINGDGIADLVAGQGTGSPSKVALRNGATGNSLGVITPFGRKFPGGVRVGLTDVNKDGRLDLVLGAGPSPALLHSRVGPSVLTFDGLTHQAIDQFFAFAKTFLGGVFVGGSH